MTDEQLSVSRKHVDTFYKTVGLENSPNMSFIKGHIEFLDKAGIKDDSFDLVISNCVINLSPNKPRTLTEIYRVLAPGGELYFSDVYCDRRVSEEAKKDEILWGECISGALYYNDFKSLAQWVGFTTPRVLQIAPIDIQDAEMRRLLGNA